MAQEFRSGFVAIIGKPNVGKSTILNALLGQKLAIVSEKPETTRDNIRGVLTTERAQAVFIDTPGIHKPHLLLGRSMVKKAKASLFDADILLLVLEVTSGLSSEDFLIIDLIKEAKKPAMVLINKIDAVSKGRILPMIDEIRESYDFLNFIPISALKGDNMLMVKEEILRNLPRGDKYYPDEQVTDKDDLFQAQEIIREKLLSATREELPHSIAVKIEKFARRPDKDIIDIEAVIYVERESQKGIIIGKKGDMAKRIGVESRQELEKKFNNKIFLRTWVKVLKNWRKDPRCLKILGVD